MNTRHRKLTRTAILRLLNELESSAGTAATLYLPADTSKEEIAAYLKQIRNADIDPQEIENPAVSSQTGSVLFLGQARKVLISPPFPITAKYIAGGYDTAILKDLLARDCTIGIILVRLGSYSIGIAEGERLVLHKSGTGLVHGRQRQGGSSSNRYRRRREEQTHHFMARVAGHIEEKLAPHADRLDYLVYGGARTTIQELRKHSRFLARFDDRLLPPLLTIPDPRFEVLQRSVTEIWSSWITEWGE